MKFDEATFTTHHDGKAITVAYTQVGAHSWKAEIAVEGEFVIKVPEEEYPWLKPCMTHSERLVRELVYERS